MTAISAQAPQKSAQGRKEAYSGYPRDQGPGTASSGPHIAPDSHTHLRTGGGDLRTTRITVADIKAETARFYATTIGQLEGKTRRRPLVHYRMIAIAIACDLTGKSHSDIGRHFGGRDHSTVLNACRRVANTPDLADQADAIKAIIRDKQFIIAAPYDFWVRRYPFKHRSA